MRCNLNACVVALCVFHDRAASTSIRIKLEALRPAPEVLRTTTGQSRREQEDLR